MPLTIRRTAGLLTALAVLTATFSLPVLRDPLHMSFPNTTRDNYFYVWSFWWVKHAVLTGKSLFHTDLLYFPYGTTLIFTEFIPLYALLSLPLLVISASPAICLLALNMWTLSSFVFFGWAVYLFTRWETGSEKGALVAGLILPFSAFRFHHLEHISLLWSAWIPLVAWFAGSWCLKPGGKSAGGAGFNSPSVVWLLGLGACGVGLAFSSYSLLIFTGFLLAGWFSVSLLFDRSRLLPGAWWRMASAITVLGAGTLPGTRYWLQSLVTGDAPQMPPEAALRYGADLAGFFLPTRSLLLGDLASSLSIPTHGPGGDEMFLGYVFLGLAATGVGIAGKGRLGLWLTALAALAVSIGPVVWLAGQVHSLPLTPYSLLMKFVPALVAARTPERYIMVFQLALAPFVALGFERITGRWGRPAVIVIAIVAIVELYPALGPFERVTVSPAFLRLRDDPAPGAVLEFSGRADGVMRALLNQTVHERPIVGDPLSRPSRDSRSLARELDAFRRLSGERTAPAAMDELGRAGVRYLVLEREGMDNRIRESFIDLWSRHADVVSRDEECVIFQMRPK